MRSRFCRLSAISAVGRLDSEAALRTPFLKTLSDAGFAIGQNIEIEYRFSKGRDEQLPALAAELLRRRVTILVATDRPSALAAKAATNTIPIVFHSADDPVRIGLVQSLNRPNGNATGISVLNNHLGPKRLGLLREMLPKPGLIAFLVNPNSTSTAVQIHEMQEAALTIKQPLLILNASTESEADAAFATMSRKKLLRSCMELQCFFKSLPTSLSHWRRGMPFQHYTNGASSWSQVD